MSAYQIDAQVLIKYLVIWNRTSQIDHVLIGLFFSQRSLGPQRKSNAD